MAINVTDKIANKVINNLDGVISIAKNEQLKQGDYIFPEIDEKLKESGAICGGHKACLIGSLYLSHGIDPVRAGDRTLYVDGRYQTIPGYSLPNTLYDDRTEFINRRPALKLSYKYINDAAERYVKKFHKDVVAERQEDYLDEDVEFVPEDGWGEFLFETCLADKSYNTIRDTVILVIRNAKRNFKRDYKEVLVSA